MDNNRRKTCMTCLRYHMDEVDPTRGTCEVSKRRLVDGNRKVITSEDRKMFDAILYADKLRGTEEHKKYVLCDFHDLTDEEWEKWRKQYASRTQKH